MTTGAPVLLIILLALIVLAIVNVMLSKAAERRNPPVGSFLQCEGVQLHYVERGNPNSLA
jgi:hypothetical protein